MDATVQMNLRIDADLKRRGDEALAKAGYTPSRAVRALWRLAVDADDRPAAIAAALEPRGATGEVAVAEERRGRHAAIERGWHLCDAFLREHGIDPGGSCDDLPSDAELRAETFEERWAERGLL